jgi:glycosyltransferase involved in cell wall biosynthesis
VPFASILVPTCRRPERLVRALASLRAQSLDDWEAIVVDDGDGEGVAAVRDLGEDRVRAVRSEGSGQVDARSTAIRLARGEVLCWLDDDDWWDDPEHLALVRAAAARPGFWFRAGWIVHEREGTREVFDHDATPASLLENNTILTSSIAYPRALHDELGPLDRDLGGYCDWDFMLRMCGAGLEPRKLAGLGVCYSVHDENLSTAYDAPERRRGFERFAAKHGLEIRIANHVTMHRTLTGA